MKCLCGFIFLDSRYAIEMLNDLNFSSCLSCKSEECYSLVGLLNSVNNSRCASL